jgi:hypothetical protein
MANNHKKLCRGYWIHLSSTLNFQATPSEGRSEYDVSNKPTMSYVDDSEPEYAFLCKPSVVFYRPSMSDHDDSMSDHEDSDSEYTFSNKPTMSDVDCHREIVQAVEKIDHIVFTDPAKARVRNAEANQSEVIRLCKRFPALVSHSTYNALQFDRRSKLHATRSSYKEWYHTFGRDITPLGYLVVSGARAETIKKFVKSHKEILSETSFLNKNSPLHFAAVHCKLTKPGVLRILTTAFPAEAVRKMTANQHMTKPRSPLLELLNRHADNMFLDDLKAIVEATYPRGLSHEDAVELQNEVFNISNPRLFGYLVDFIMVAQPVAVIAQSSYYFCGCHAQGISKLLSTGRVTDLRLTIDFMASDFSLVDFFDSLRVCASSIKVLHLKLGLNRLDSDTLRDVFAAAERCLLAKSDSLRELHLSGRSYVRPSVFENFDFTKSVLTFLASNIMMDITIDSGFHVTTTPIFDALKYNTCVRRMNLDTLNDDWEIDMQALASVLWYYNTTLEEVTKTNASSNFYFVVEGLTALNKRGRRDLRDPNVPVGKAVDLLAFVNCKNVKGWPTTILNYAVLRECPGTWSSPPYICKRSVSGRKRIHSRISQQR